MTRRIALLVAGLALVLTGCAPHWEFGDSLADSSAPEYQAASPDVVQFGVYGGTALCDWADRIVAEAKKTPAPRVIVLNFSGNAWGGCMGGTKTADEVVTKYRLAMLNIRARTPGQRYVLVRGPVGLPPAGFFATDSRAVGWVDGFPGVCDAGNVVAPGHRYTSHVNGRQVRTSDRVHLTAYGDQLYASAIDRCTR